MNERGQTQETESTVDSYIDGGVSALDLKSDSSHRYGQAKHGMVADSEISSEDITDTVIVQVKEPEAVYLEMESWLYFAPGAVEQYNHGAASSLCGPCFASTTDAWRILRSHS